MERSSGTLGSAGPTPIARVFDELSGRDQAALIPYITAGDPDLEMTALLLRTLATAGADLIELGVPFSDPTADGPVIQRAAERALSRGVTLEKIFEMLESLRDAKLPPIVLFGYYNPFLQYGLSRLAKRAAGLGIGGFLVVDLPIEESGALRRELAGHAIDLIQLVAPTTPEARMQEIAELASGFLYFVSRTGVTGAARPDPHEVRERVQLMRALTDLPIAVGFGVRTADQAFEIASFADGVVVGSALVELSEQHSGGALLLALEGQVRALKAATAR